MPKVKRPKRGSMGFWPRKRARRIYPRIKKWPEAKEIKPVGFAGYKVGTTHVSVIDSNPNSKTKGQVITKAATILDCPSISVFGFRAYKKTPYAFKTFSDVFAEKFSKNLQRKKKIKKTNSKESLKKIEESIDKISNFVLLCHTNPSFKKKPEIFEIQIGGFGGNKKQLEYANSVLGKEIKISDIFTEGDYIDVIAVTKGKGFQGPVKRFGVRILGRKCEHEHRKIAPKGQKEPGKVRSTIPQGGQMGFQSRTELNKRILKIAKPKEVLQTGGFLRYGNLGGDAVVIEGSVPGSSKRLIRLRIPIRAPKTKYPEDVKFISTSSKQGV